MWNFLKKMTLWVLVFILLILIAGTFGWYKWFMGPSHPVVTETRLQAAVIELGGDTNLVEFISEMKEKNVIKSEKVALSLIQRFGIEKNIKQGIYVFKGGENIFEIMNRLSDASFGYSPVKVTIPEGFTVERMAETYSTKLVDITEEDFIKNAEQYEGYLFPDTYFFYPYATSGVAISMMLNNFDRRVAPYKNEFLTLIGSTTAATTTDVIARTYGIPKSAEDIIIMASILEKEVQTNKDKAMVADLFWRRIREGMAIQADSTLTYVTGKTSAQLTTKDLRDASPYNSYTNRGLPPTPISNPGIESIKAALFPQKNTYVYFLSDDDGNTHFSETYKGHLELKERYLR
jgi:UPF0755 protein